MSTDTRVEPGDVRRLKVTIRNIDGDPDDPGGLVFTMNAPNSNPVAYTYGNDSELVRESEGVYFVDWAVEDAGTHRYSWASSGENQAYSEGYFLARARTVVAS